MLVCRLCGAPREDHVLGIFYPGSSGSPPALPAKLPPDKVLCESWDRPTIPLFLEDVLLRSELPVFVQRLTVDSCHPLHEDDPLECGPDSVPVFVRFPG